MGKNFCIPTYLEDSVLLNNTSIAISDITDALFVRLCTNKEVAEELSNRVNSTIGPATITKILKHYNIKPTEEQKRLKNKNRAKKTAENLKEQYGISNVFQLETTKEKARKTKTERYNNSAFVNPDKAKVTCLEKYGVNSYSSTAECRKQVKATNLQKYGVETPAQNKDILAKMQQTCMDRFGVDNYWKSEEFKQRAQQKYFSDYQKLSDEYKEIYKDAEKLKQHILLLEDKTTIGIAEHFGISRASAYLLLAKNNLLGLAEINYNTSHYELEIAEYIGTDLCELNNRTALQGKEIDIYVPSKKLGIEFNGNYWHSSDIKAKNYHFEKSKLAEQLGIRLIHIWEYEWENKKQQEKIKLLLDIALGRVSNKISARKCEIKQISNKEAAKLNNSVHLQSHRNAQVTYGLFYKDELVQLMSFSHTRYNKNINNDNEWEIIRGCPGSNNIVVGGVSRLLKHFIADYKPTKIFSYCDFNKFDGRSYEAAGMTFVGYTGPDMKWLLSDGTVVNRAPRQHDKLKKLAKAKLFGAGSKKYILELNN